jgi:uncharacterized protein YecT (DUF1311 family)
MFAAALLSVGTVMPVAAQEFRCNPEGNTAEMAQCARDDYGAADERLNDVYQKLLRSLTQADEEFGDGGSDTRVKRLKAAQRAWIAFRDAECPLQSVENFGGSMENITIPGCLARITEERAAQLEKILDPQ